MAVSKDEAQQRLKSFLDICRRLGLKATPQRLHIFRVVAETDEHPEADVIIAKVREVMPTVSADTVYRTLAFLEDNGLIQKLSRLHGCARYDANLRKHHHFVCVKCGAAWDFYCEKLDTFAVPDEVTNLGTVESLHAELHGICKACQAALGE